MPSNQPACSCGVSEDHIVARSATSDGVTLALWHDGSITSRMGLYVQGVGATRSPERDLAAARLVWQDVCLYTWEEVPLLIKLARRAIVQTQVPALTCLRRLLRDELDKPNAARLAAARARGQQ